MDGKEIAAAYEIHPQVLKNFGIHVPAAAFEINFTRFSALPEPAFAYRPLPRYPGIEIDVSVLIPRRTEVRLAEEIIRRADQKLIAKVALIDIFEDASLGDGKKSFTFRILLQSPERTLTDAEMKQVQEKIFEGLKKAGFAIRGES
ncbi:hypothetical protein HYV58_00990 [Candidatus Peregrinibacteria bacterium]|nr:hypothetical protein [Candidatus Peregrinibacteria bacterium]